MNTDNSHAKPGRVVPLAMLPPGSEAVIESFLGGRDFIARLLELGFSRNEKVKLERSSGGPVLVRIRGAKVAIGKGMAMKILVRL